MFAPREGSETSSQPPPSVATDRALARLEILALRRWIQTETVLFLIGARLDIPLEVRSLRVVRTFLRIGVSLERCTKEFLRGAGSGVPLVEEAEDLGDTFR
jgi:hypothetical protein